MTRDFGTSDFSSISTAEPDSAQLEWPGIFCPGQFWSIFPLLTPQQDSFEGSPGEVVLRD